MPMPTAGPGKFRPARIRPRHMMKPKEMMMPGPHMEPRTMKAAMGPFGQALARRKSPRSGTASSNPRVLRERASRLRARATVKYGG